MKCHCGLPFIGFGLEGFPGVTMTTLVGYFQAECGHTHDDNCSSRDYRCAAKHVTSLSIRKTCSCGWKGKETCFCHKGKKVDEWPKLEKAG